MPSTRSRRSVRAPRFSSRAHDLSPSGGPEPDADDSPPRPIFCVVTGFSHLAIHKRGARALRATRTMRHSSTMQSREPLRVKGQRRGVAPGTRAATVTGDVIPVHSLAALSAANSTKLRVWPWQKTNAIALRGGRPYLVGVARSRVTDGIVATICP
jgi:hypothetical protein